MCVVSMIYDHYYDKFREWNDRLTPPTYLLAPMPTQAEIDEFRKLLDRAREYDRKHNQPDCELEEKKQKLLKLAKDLGIDISFVNEAVVQQ